MAEQRRRILRERWRVLRDLGIHSDVARDARTSAVKFIDAVKSVGCDPQRWPHLLNSWRGARKSYSNARTAVEQRRRRAKLKLLGLDWVRCDGWSRSQKAMRYALIAIAEGRDIPERPGLLRTV